MKKDRLPMAKYIHPKFEKAGLSHEDPHILRSTQDMSTHYQLLIKGSVDKLKEEGYKLDNDKIIKFNPDYDKEKAA